MSRDVSGFFDELAAWVAARSVPSTSHPYGPEPEQHADLRLPAGPGPHPVAAVIHGGFWRATYTKQNTEALATALTALGWATWNLEYRRAGSGSCAETLADVASACRAVHEVDAPLDLGSIVAIGHSAGGQLALWAGAERLVAGVIGLAPISDLISSAQEKIGDGAVLEFMGGAPAGMRAAYATADPLRRLPLRIPQVLVHGSADDRVPLRQSRYYRDVAVAAGDPCLLLEQDGADHFDVIDPRARPWSALREGLEWIRAAVVT